MAQGHLLQRSYALHLFLSLNPLGKVEDLQQGSKCGQKEVIWQRYMVRGWSHLQVNFSEAVSLLQEHLSLACLGNTQAPGTKGRNKDSLSRGLGEKIVSVSGLRLLTPSLEGLFNEGACDPPTKASHSVLVLQSLPMQFLLSCPPTLECLQKKKKIATVRFS